MDQSPQMLRVLSLSPRFWGGGAERAARDIFYGLASIGSKSQMYVAKLDGGEPSQVKSIRYPGERYLKAVKWIIGETEACFPGSWIALSKINTKTVDVVHVHNIHSDWVAVSAIKHLSRRMPVVWSLHDEWSVSWGLPYDLHEALRTPLIRDYFNRDAYKHDTTTLSTPGVKQRFSARLPNPVAVISPSKYIARMAADNVNLKTARNYVIPYGLPLLSSVVTRLPRSEARQRLGIPHRKHTLLLIAAHLRSPYKGMWLAEQMCHRLDREMVHLIVAGHESEQFARRAGLNFTSLGYLRTDEQLATAYRAADITVIPSIADNFPYVALESLACETPIACFDVGGLTEIVGQHERGYLAKRYDVAELAHGVEYVLGDKDKQLALGCAGRQWVERHCDMSCYMQQINTVYRDAIVIHQERDGRMH